MVYQLIFSEIDHIWSKFDVVLSVRQIKKPIQTGWAKR